MTDESTEKTAINADTSAEEGDGDEEEDDDEGDDEEEDDVDIVENC